MEKDTVMKLVARVRENTCAEQIFLVKCYVSPVTPSLAPLNLQENYINQNILGSLDFFFFFES